MNTVMKPIIVTFLLVSFHCQADQKISDPLDSPQWEVMHQIILDSGPVEFDERVTVITPDFAEDPMNVPVSVSIEGIDDIEEIVVFVDLNPIWKVLSFRPIRTEPYLSFRIKVEQSTPVRAAARTSDGIWHVGGRWLNAAGGGCSAPSVGRAAGGWEETLGLVRSRLWFRDNGSGRLRFRIMHPMDTGLADGIPEFFIEELVITDDQDARLAMINTFQPVSENPVFTLNLPPGVKKLGDLILNGIDNNGNRIRASLGK